MKTKLIKLLLVAGMLLPAAASADDHVPLDCTRIGGDGLPYIGEWCKFNPEVTFDEVDEVCVIENLPELDYFWVKSKRSLEVADEHMNLEPELIAELEAMLSGGAHKGMYFQSTEVDPLASRFASLTTEQFINLVGLNITRGFGIFLTEKNEHGLGANVPVLKTFSLDIQEEILEACRIRR